jgi:hypothetical protein
VAVLLISGELTGAGKLLSGGIDGTKQLHGQAWDPSPFCFLCCLSAEAFHLLGAQSGSCSQLVPLPGMRDDDCITVYKSGLPAV